MVDIHYGIPIASVFFKTHQHVQVSNNRYHLPLPRLSTSSQRGLSTSTPQSAFVPLSQLLYLFRSSVSQQSLAFLARLAQATIPTEPEHDTAPLLSQTGGPLYLFPGEKATTLWPQYTVRFIARA